MVRIKVEVVYALAGEADAVTVEVPQGATVRDAVAASGILGRHPEIGRAQVGVFGRTVAPDCRVAEGDRIEIYRPLLLDPKEARRRRAKKRR
jgi:putative ubiquitin-RnfH superfamily antitoxin RatB of RatAB toxin-antitoxin module